MKEQDFTEATEVNFPITEPISDDEDFRSEMLGETLTPKAADSIKSLQKRSFNYLENHELRFIPRRTRSTVSRLNDGNDQWDANELDTKEEHTLILSDHQLKHSLMERLNTFRRNRELCDVVLFVKEHEILAHKVVLASISNALFDMFQKESDDVSNSMPNEPTSSGINSSLEYLDLKNKQINGDRFANYFEFAQGDYDCFEAIVNFAYTSRLEISSWKVADLYKTAYCLQVYPIVKACARYLAENLSVNNCLGIRKQANFNNDEFLVRKVDSFITQNIEKIISDSAEFTQLPCIKVRIIVDRNLVLEGGQNLAEKSLQYFQQYPKISDRIEQQIEALVEKPHLLLVNDESQPLQNLCDADDTSSVGSCEIVQDYKRGNQVSKTAGHNNNIIGTQQIQHRITGAKAVKMNASRVANAKYASNESLTSIASTASTADDEIESRLIAVYNNSPGFWISIAVLYRRVVVFSIQCSEDDDVLRSVAKNGGGVLSKNNSCTDLNITNYNEALLSNNSSSKIIDLSALSNSFEGLMRSNSTSSQNSHSLIDSIIPRRTLLPTLCRARCSIGATFVNERIIAFGGYNRGECLKSVEELEIPNGDKWHPLPEMLDARGRFDSTVESGKIYAIAGSNGNNDLKSCECYDPKLQKWTSIKSLNKPRSHNGCTTVDGFIYCIGGSSDQNVLRDCERYNPRTNEWQPIAPLQTPRFQAGCTSWRGMVLFCAGCDRWNCLDTVEAYDPRTDTWRYLAKLKTPRRGCAVAVIKDSLYVIGGHDGTQSLSSVEVLDFPNAHTWRLGPSLNVPRANTHAVAISRKEVYVIGGFDGSQFLDSMEVLDNETLGWRTWQQHLDQSAILEEEDELKTDENKIISVNELPKTPTATNERHAIASVGV